MDTVMIPSFKVNAANPSYIGMRLQPGVFAGYAVSLVWAAFS